MGTQVVNDSLAIPWWYQVRSNPPRSGTTLDNYVARSRTWSCMANYNSRLKKALLPTQAYVDSQWKKEATPAFVYYDGVLWSFYLGTRLPVFNLSHGRVEDCLNKAIASAASKVGNYTFDLGVTAAQGKETAQMVLRAAQNLARAAGLVKRGHFLAAAQHLGIGLPGRVNPRRSFHKNWLEYRYGWRTTMMDVDGAVRALAESCIAKPIYAYSSSVMKDEWRQTETGFQGVFGSYDKVFGSTTSLRDWSCGASITYKYVVTNSWGSSANSLGLVNLATLAWEVIPYSFVVDWFGNIGTVIQNLGSFTGKTLADGTRCRWIQCDSRESVTNITVTNNRKQPSAVKGVPRSRSTMRLFDRSKIDFLSPTPHFSLEMNWMRGIDAVSLLIPFLRR